MSLSHRRRPAAAIALVDHHGYEGKPEEREPPPLSIELNTSIIHAARDRGLDLIARDDLQTTVNTMQDRPEPRAGVHRW